MRCRTCGHKQARMSECYRCGDPVCVYCKIFIDSDPIVICPECMVVMEQHETRSFLKKDGDDDCN